jgi:glucosyl-3-phosphoglycerate synthase
MVLGTVAASPGQGVLSARARAILDTIPLPAVVVYIPAERDASAAPALAPYAVNVDKWFAENTFDADEFDDIAQLVVAKRAQGLSISLALPALNEAETAGKVIAIVREALVDTHPLLDEIVLIDGGSTDDTMQIAEDAGATVYFGPDVLADMGHYHGKGEVLWKSLYVTKGDIVAWIDTDITNIHPRFVYGILGPLLVAPHVKYVKGFYRRPLRVGDKLQASGGGRVTELVVRPLFNLFFPELSGLLQPLAGEYAGRREVLTRVPFFSSYAVETGLLIDILDQFGLFAIAQVDLKERIHRNQSLRALSKMSFVIIQALLARLDKHEIVRILGDPSRSMKLVGDEDGRLFLDIEDLTDNERPPMVTVPAYRARRQI